MGIIQRYGAAGHSRYVRAELEGKSALMAPIYE